MCSLSGKPWSKCGVVTHKSYVKVFQQNHKKFPFGFFFFFFISFNRPSRLESKTIAHNADLFPNVILCCCSKGMKYMDFFHIIITSLVISLVRTNVPLMSRAWGGRGNSSTDYTSRTPTWSLWDLVCAGTVSCSAYGEYAQHVQTRLTSAYSTLVQEAKLGLESVKKILVWQNCVTTLWHCCCALLLRTAAAPWRVLSKPCQNHSEVKKNNAVHRGKDSYVPPLTWKAFFSSCKRKSVYNFLLLNFCVFSSLLAAATSSYCPSGAFMHKRR